MVNMAEEELSLIDLDQNLADVEKPPELPPGRYTGEVQGVEIKNSQAGNQYFAIKLVIPTDEIPADVAEHYEDGAILYWNRNIVPNGKDRRALYNLRKLIEALGLASNTSQINPNDWMGCKTRISVVHEKYQGENRAQIKMLEPAEAAKPAPARTRAKGK
jgi:hypothetical protein